MKSGAKRIAVVPGDGIGPEVINEAVGVLERLGDTHGVKLNLRHFDWGAEKFLSEGGFMKRGTPDEIATQEELNTRKGVERIVVAAFEYARERGRRRVTMADKSNVQRFGGDLWQRVFKETAARYTEIEANHQYVDARTMYMFFNPARYVVIL